MASIKKTNSLIYINVKNAIVIGATGLIGNYCLEELLQQESYAEIISFTRKPLNISHPKHKNQVIDFDKLENYKSQIIATDVYCCLGTTIGTAGSQEAFKKVDYEYPVKFAQVAKENGTEQYIVISSLGANKNASTFYLKTKGEMEEALKKINFPSLLILRPSILLGPRKEFRFGELIGKFIMQALGILFIGSLKKYKGIHAKKVAHAMIKYAQHSSKRMRILESTEIAEA